MDSVLTITFNQPVGNANQENLPCQPIVIPAEPLNSKWRMINEFSLVLQLDPEHPWKKSTKYVVKVPSGVASIYGTKLIKDVTWEFLTATPHLIDSWPTEDRLQSTVPVLVAQFDQEIEPEEIVKVISVKEDSLARFGIFCGARLATEQDIRRYPEVKRRLLAHPKTSVAFCAVKPLPNLAKIKVVVGPNVSQFS
jgi:hypothetical protein